MDAEDAKDLERYIKDKRRAEAKCNLTEVAQLCNCIGEMYSKYGRYEDAVQEHSQERQLSETLGDRIGEAIACRKIGENLCSQGLYQEALEQQKKHLIIARECGNHIEEQRAWATIGRTYLSQAETKHIHQSLVANKKAEKAFVKALEACEQVKASVKPAEFMSMKGRIYLNLGLVYDLRGELKDSADMMKRAVVIAEKFKLDEETYLCHSSLSSLYQKGNQYSQALRSLDVALTVAEKLRNKVWERETYVQKATVHASCADFLGAKHCLKKAHKLKIDSDVCEGKLVKMFLCVNKMQEATLDLQTKTSQKELAKLNEIMADSAAELGNFTQAIEYYLKVLEFSSVMSSSERAGIYVSLAQSHADVRQYDSAIFYYNKELEERKDDPEQACRTYLNIAELQELKGSTYPAICKMYMSAYEAAKKAKHTSLQVQTLKSLIALQQTREQTIHLEETQRKLNSLLQKKSLQDNCDSDDDDEGQSDKAEGLDDDGSLSLSDLTVSEESDNDCRPGRPDSKKKVVRRNEKGETALHRASIDGNLKKVKSLIAEGHPVNTRDFCGWLPLHEACNHGHVSVVEHLLDAGAWINDRGGERCGGVTPLIDAANCGHLDVVRLLAERGAQVNAKDDDHNTALDCLRAWYSRTEDVLELADEIEYKKVEKLLRDLMGHDHSTKHRPGTSKKQPTTSLTRTLKEQSRPSPEICPLPDLYDDNITESRTCDYKQRKSTLNERLRKLRQKRESRLMDDSSVQMSAVQENLTSSDDEFPDIYRRPSTRDDTGMSSSEVYRLAINSVATSAQKRSDVGQTSDVEDDTDSAVVRPLPSLVDVDEEVGDDWLVDDIKWPQPKRKSTSVSNVLATSSTRNESRKRTRRDDAKLCRNSKSSPASKRNKHAQSYEDRNLVRTSHERPDIVTIETIRRLEMSCPVSSSTESVNDNNRSKKDVPRSTEYEWDSDDDILCQIDTFDDGCDMDIQISQTDSIKSNHSTRITAAGTSRETSANYIPEPRNRDNRVINATSVQREISQFDSNLRTDWRKIVDMSAATKPQVVETSRSPPPEKPTYVNSIRVKVKIGEQTLLLPIKPVDQEKNISWLSQQIRDRYFSMFLLLPTLTLSTKDGIILCPSDTISTILQDNDLLVANVSAWERPKLEDRYIQACKLNLTDANIHIISLLQKTDQSGQLQISDMGLGLSLLQPVFQALGDHKILTELRLNGNRLGDAGIESLMKLLNGLPHLKILSLETNGISAEGIQTMATALKLDPCLHVLSTLSLSHNCLDDMAAEDLASIIGNLPKLCHLSLCSCNFSHRMFSSSLCQALTERSLEHLNISENNLQYQGIKCLLQILHSDNLKQLNISHTCPVSDQDISPHLQDFVSIEPCRLQELSVAGNHISPADVTFMNRLPVLAKSLRSLVLSQNLNINNTSLQKLLYISADRNSELVEIIARGCSISSPLGSEFLDALKSKMTSPVPLRRFVFTCRGLKESDSKVLGEVWMTAWKDQGLVKTDGMTVSLTVT